MVEKVLEYQIPVYLCFVDLFKAYDIVDCTALVAILRSHWCPTSWWTSSRSSTLEQSATSEQQTIVQELDRYDIREAALQETEWYENAVYHAGESVLLTAGCATLASGEEMQREKGMAIVLSGPAIAA